MHPSIRQYVPAIHLPPPTPSPTDRIVKCVETRGTATLRLFLNDFHPPPIQIGLQNKRCTRCISWQPSLFHLCSSCTPPPSPPPPPTISICLLIRCSSPLLPWSLRCRIPCSISRCECVRERVFAHVCICIHVCANAQMYIIQYIHRSRSCSCSRSRSR